MSRSAWEVGDASPSYDFQLTQPAIPVGYKQTEVGIIPEDWEECSLADKVDFLTGFPFPSESFSFSGIRLLRGSNVKRGELDWSEEISRYWSTHLSVLKQYELKSGDLVIAMDGALVGRSYASVREHDLPALLVQRVARIRSTKIHQDLLKYWIASKSFVSHVDLRKTHTAIPHISPKDIRDFKIAIPTSLEEQRAIATALSDVDALLEGLDRLIAKKRDLKQAAMQQLLTGQVRLPGFEGEWEVRRLGDYVQFLKNGVHSRAQLTGDGSLKNLHYGDIHTCTQVMLDPRITTMPSLPADCGWSLDRLRDGDLVFVDASEDLGGVGKSIELTNVSDVEVVSGLHTIAARFNKSVLADGFKGYLQFHPEFRAHLTSLAAGTKVYATSRAHIASAELRLPCTREQEAIAAVLSDMDAEIDALEQRRTKTAALKQAMMQELLTGRTRLV